MACSVPVSVGRWCRPSACSPAAMAPEDPGTTSSPAAGAAATSAYTLGLAPAREALLGGAEDDEGLRGLLPVAGVLDQGADGVEERRQTLVGDGREVQALEGVLGHVGLAAHRQPGPLQEGGLVAAQLLDQ